jgi:hypothetical protein
MSNSPDTPIIEISEGSVDSGRDYRTDAALRPQPRRPRRDHPNAFDVRSRSPPLVDDLLPFRPRLLVERERTVSRVKNSDIAASVDDGAEHLTVVEAVKQAVHGNGQVLPSPSQEPLNADIDQTAQDNVTPLQAAVKAAKPQIDQGERASLDEYEDLADDAILDDDEGDAPGDKDEISRPLVVKKLPKFVVFRASLTTFDLWGTSDQQGMDELLFVTTRSFAPRFEEDVELRRVRFFETVTTDGVIRLVWCMVPEKTGRQPNSWQTSKLAALEHAQSQWTTMRTRMKLSQYTFRPSSKQKEHGEPKFSGRTPQQWVAELKKLGMLVDSKDHEFYRKATDSE